MGNPIEQEGYLCAEYFAVLDLVGIVIIAKEIENDIQIL
jgi:hypothetical protein